MRHVPLKGPFRGAPRMPHLREPESGPGILRYGLLEVSRSPGSFSDPAPVGFFGAIGPAMRDRPRAVRGELRRVPAPAAADFRPGTPLSFPNAAAPLPREETAPALAVRNGST